MAALGFTPLFTRVEHLSAGLTLTGSASAAGMGIAGTGPTGMGTALGFTPLFTRVEHLCRFGSDWWCVSCRNGCNGNGCSGNGTKRNGGSRNGCGRRHGCGRRQANSRRPTQPVRDHDPLIFSFFSLSFLIGWEFYGPNYLRC